VSVKLKSIFDALRQHDYYFRKLIYRLMVKRVLPKGHQWWNLSLSANKIPK